MDPLQVLKARINKACDIEVANKAIKITFKFASQAPQYAQQAIKPKQIKEHFAVKRKTTMGHVDVSSTCYGDFSYVDTLMTYIFHFTLEIKAACTTFNRSQTRVSKAKD
jgi:hypothetical protein